MNRGGRAESAAPRCTAVLVDVRFEWGLQAPGFYPSKTVPRPIL
jgi:hypothetical protein